MKKISDNYILNSKAYDFVSNNGVYPIEKEYVPNVSYKVKRKATNTATNLVTNGDFSSGTISGWNGSNATVEYFNGGLKAVGNGQGGGR